MSSARFTQNSTRAWLELKNPCLHSPITHNIASKYLVPGQNNPAPIPSSVLNPSVCQTMVSFVSELWTPCSTYFLKSVQWESVSQNWTFLVLSLLKIPSSELLLSPWLVISFDQFCHSHACLFCMSPKLDGGVWGLGWSSMAALGHDLIFQGPVITIFSMTFLL